MKQETFQQVRVIILILYFQIHETDKLGKLGLTIKGCKERDNFVLQTCFDLKIPVMCSIGGGYSLDINIIVNAHANTFRLAQEIYF